MVYKHSNELTFSYSIKKAHNIESCRVPTHPGKSWSLLSWRRHRIPQLVTEFLNWRIIILGVKTNVWILAVQFTYLLFYCIAWSWQNLMFLCRTENGAYLLDIVQSWKMILGGHGKFFMEHVWEPWSRVISTTQMQNKPALVFTHFRCILTCLKHYHV